MTEKKYGCVVVLGSNKKIKGIITDGDLRRIIYKYLNRERKIKDLYTKKYISYIMAKKL